MLHRGALPILLLFVTASGCSAVTIAANKMNPFHKEPLRATPQNPVVEVACIWQPGEGRNDKGIPCRGVTGQVFFFTRKNSEPALVDGDVRVYLFSDRGSDEDRAKPLHQYDFIGEAWGLHATQTSLGPGYSVFVPYPDSDPYQARCQLRLRFEPVGGGTLYSESVAVMLDGRARPTEGAASTSPTVREMKVEHRSGTLEELNGRTAADDGSRKLKTSTFSLDGRGALIPVGYDEPADAKPRPRAAGHPLTGDSMRSASHPLTGGVRTTQTATPAALHPLTGRPREVAPGPLPAGDAIELQPERRFRLGGSGTPSSLAPSIEPDSAAVLAPVSEAGRWDAPGWQPLDSPNF